MSCVRAPSSWIDQVLYGYVADPGQHILANQLLIGVSGNPFTFSGKLRMAPMKHLLAATVFSSVLGLALNSLLVFFPFRSFFTLKTNLPNLTKQSPKCWRPLKLHGGAPLEPHYLMAFVRCHHHCSFWVRLYAYGYTNMGPHFLWKQNRPPTDNLGSCRRPGKMHCTDLPNTLYTILDQLYMRLKMDYRRIRWNFRLKLLTHYHFQERKLGLPLPALCRAYFHLLYVRLLSTWL